MKITIPPTLEAAVADLNGIGVLVTAKEWHRAAIVASYVEIGEPNNQGGKPVSSDRLSPSEFAALGINGLLSKNTVRRYVEAWQSTGLPIPARDAEIDLPDLPWPPGGETKEDHVKKNLKSVVKALKDDTFRAKVVQAAAEDDDGLLYDVITDAIAVAPPVQAPPARQDVHVGPQAQFDMAWQKVRALMDQHPDYRQRWSDTIKTDMMEVML